MPCCLHSKLNQRQAADVKVAAIQVLKRMKLNKNIIFPLVLLPIWFTVYVNLQSLTDWVIDSVLHMTKGAHLTEL